VQRPGIAAEILPQVDLAHAHLGSHCIPHKHGLPGHLPPQRPRLCLALSAHDVCMAHTEVRGGPCAGARSGQDPHLVRLTPLLLACMLGHCLHPMFSEWWGVHDGMPGYEAFLCCSQAHGPRAECLHFNSAHSWLVPSTCRVCARASAGCHARENGCGIC
jgi:hypothetical protein